MAVRRAARPWRIRRRLVVVVTIAAAAPSVALAYWVVRWLTIGLPLVWAVMAVAVWVGAVAGVAAIYGVVAARRLVGPLEALTESLRRFDPSLGDVGHPALIEGPAEPEETAALKRALRGAVERIGRDRAQKEAVMAGLMHDLKTPIVAQGLLVEQLEPAGSHRSAVVIEQLVRSSHGAVARLNRLIDVLRVDSAGSRGARRPGDVRATVDDAIANLAPLILARGTEVEVSGRWEANLDLATVQRAVENVIANAVRHARARVQVAVYPGLVTVTDDGPGFAVPFEEVVDPFRPGPVSVDRPAGTAGLGLYIARRSLESLGGRLKLAASDPGLTTVLLYLGPTEP